MGRRGHATPTADPATSAGLALWKSSTTSSWCDRGFVLVVVGGHCPKAIRLVAFAHLANKTVNNILSHLRTMLTSAVEWGLLERMPVEIKRLKGDHEADEVFRLRRIGSAGHRGGGDRSAQAAVRLARWRGGLAVGRDPGVGVEVDRLPSTGAHRRAVRVEGSRHAAQARQDPTRAHDREAHPSASRLPAPAGPRVFYLDDEDPLLQRTLRRWLEKVCVQAGIEVHSPHSLRHTFCSHLAMRGAPTRAIQELAGHSDLKTTQRYMHLTPAALERDRAARTARAGHSAGDSAVWRQVGDGLSEPDLRRQGFWFQ
jgi:hypothetical protein